MPDNRQHQANSEHPSAMARAKASPREHVPRHVTSRDVRVQMHGSSPIGRFNDLLAVGVTKVVGSMWAAYIFVLIALVSFPQALIAFLNGDTIVGVTWLSQSFLQLVLLPIFVSWAAGDLGGTRCKGGN